MRSPLSGHAPESTPRSMFRDTALDTSRALAAVAADMAAAATGGSNMPPLLLLLLAAEVAALHAGDVTAAVDLLLPT